MTCAHNDREWVNGETFNPNYDNAIAVRTLCLKCAALGYEIYKFSNFEVDEQ